MRATEISLFVRSASGEVVAKSADRLMESSSTIKIPILYLALLEATMKKHDLGHKLERLTRHSSRGSGVLNWTPASQFSLADLITTTVIYSDCLATNMLLDYIGGQTRLNDWLAQHGFSTRLHMPYLDFSDQEVQMPSVGTTSAREIAALFGLLSSTDWPDPLKKLVTDCTGRINESWLELSLPEPLGRLHHKTGSMIDSGSDGETVFNAAGRFEKHGGVYCFGLLSRGYVRPGDDASIERLKHFVARQLAGAVDAS